MIEKAVCSWRVTQAEPSGFHVWFDPQTEHVRLFHGPPTEQRLSLEGLRRLDDGGVSGYLDKVGSVSGSDGDGDDTVISDDEQARLFEEETGLPF